MQASVPASVEAADPASASGCTMSPGFAYPAAGTVQPGFRRQPELVGSRGARCPQRDHAVATPRARHPGKAPPPPSAPPLGPVISTTFRAPSLARAPSPSASSVVEGPANPQVRQLDEEGRCAGSRSQDGSLNNQGELTTDMRSHKLGR